MINSLNEGETTPPNYGKSEPTLPMRRPFNMSRLVFLFCHQFIIDIPLIKFTPFSRIFYRKYFGYFALLIFVEWFRYKL